MKQESKSKSKVQITKIVRKSKTGRPPRLYLRAVFQGYRRTRRSQRENQARLRVEGLNDRTESRWYLGKRVVHVYKSSKGFKTIWGKIISSHGNNGTVLAKFRKNLPPKAIGSTVRVMLYPQRT